MPVSIPEAFLLEDNPRELETLSELVRGHGLEPVATRSPAQALRLLEVRRPTLAIVDWDMREAPGDDVATSEPVLRHLHGQHPNTTTIIHAAHTLNLNLQTVLVRAHPSALLHDKQLGHEMLLTRIGQLLEKQVGDLAVRAGVVVHLASGDSFRHTAALTLVLRHPRPVQAQRGTSVATGVHRFQRWLTDKGSTVRCEPQKRGVYRLVTGP